MKFLTGRAAIGKSYSVAEYLRDKEEAIYIIDDLTSYREYDFITSKPNVYFYSSSQWNVDLIEQIKENNRAIIIVEGVYTKEGKHSPKKVKTIINGIRNHLNDNDSYECIVILFEDELVNGNLMEKQDIHLNLDKDYRTNRELGLIGNPLMNK